MAQEMLTFKFFITAFPSSLMIYLYFQSTRNQMYATSATISTQLYIDKLQLLTFNFQKACSNLKQKFMPQAILHSYAWFIKHHSDSSLINLITIRFIQLIKDLLKKPHPYFPCVLPNTSDWIYTSIHTHRYIQVHHLCLIVLNITSH